MIALSFSLLLVLASGWVADGLNGTCLWEPFWPCLHHDLQDVVLRTGIAFGMFVVAFAALYHLAKSFVPIRHLAKVEVKPHKALIIPVTSIYPLPEQHKGQWRLRLKRQNEDVDVLFSGNFDQDIENLTQANKWNGEQLLRALHAHAGHIEQIFLIGSAGDRGSFKHLEVIRGMISSYLPKVQTRCVTRPVDFEDIEEMQRIYEQCIQELKAAGIPEREIIIDVTGGQKTTSIAAALTTLRWKRIEFQYIQTGEKKNALGFNVVVEAPEKAEL